MILNEGIFEDSGINLDEATWKEICDECFDHFPVEKEEMKYYKLIKAIHGERITDALYNWIMGAAGGSMEHGRDYYNLTREQYLDIFKSQPTGKTLGILKRTLGGGGSGVAVRLKNGLVIKKFFEDVKYNANYHYYTYCLKNKGYGLLKVKRIGKDYVISEYAEAATPKVKRIVKKLKEANLIVNKARKMGQKISMDDLVSDKEALNFYYSMQKHLSNIPDNHLAYRNQNPILRGSLSFFGDFKVANIGEAPDGELIYLDPES